MSGSQWQRAVLLYHQQRWDLAIRELRGLLTHQPGEAHAHALLAQALAAKGDLDEARAEAHRAVAAGPDLDFAHHALAAVLFQRDELDSAIEAIEIAIRLDPDDANHHGMLAQIRYGQRRWQDALDAADRGLTIDPHDVDCLNLRSLALTKLGRGREAADAGTDALAKDPDNAYTHQARGWALLHTGDAKRALHHFQEALRRDPSLDGARAGLVEALKARNPIYRFALAWFLWLDRFSQGKQWMILIGAWLVARTAGSELARAGHEGAATIVRFSWLGLVLFTSCAVPLFNLLLLLHPAGRHALERSSRNHAILLGCAIALAAGVAVHAFATGARWSSASCLFLVLYLLPIAGIGVFHSGWALRVLQVFCAVLFGCWIWWLIRLELLLREEATGWKSSPAPSDTHAQAIGMCLLGCVLSTWFILLAPKGKPPRRRG